MRAVVANVAISFSIKRSWDLADTFVISSHYTDLECKYVREGEVDKEKCGVLDGGVKVRIYVKIRVG